MAREPGTRQGGRLRRRAGLSFFLLPLALLVGCARPPAEPVPLTLISPHRDEIREETALAFRDWFRERTENRLRAARDALQAFLKTDDETRRAAAERTVRDFLAD